VIMGTGTTQYLRSSNFATVSQRPLLTVTFSEIAVTSFVVTDETSGSTIYTDQPAVDVAISASTVAPATVAGYMVTESATAPLPGDPGWKEPLEDPLNSYIISAEGVKTLYGWAKNSNDEIASASVVIGYATAISPAISNIVATLGYGAMMITWDTDANAVGWVELGLSGGALDKMSPLDYGLNHTALFTGLTIGQAYDYVIHSNDSTATLGTATPRDVVTWRGPTGNSDSDGSWNDPVCWSSGTVPSAYDVVTLPDCITRTRRITVDADCEVGELRISQPGNGFWNEMQLNADITVGVYSLLNSDAGWSRERIPLYMNGHTFTVKATSGYNYLPKFNGAGTIVKDGTGTAGMGYNSSVPYTGSFVVNNGILKGWPSFDTATGITVNGGTFWEPADSLIYGPRVWLNGMGFNNGTEDLGALYSGGNVTTAVRITLVTDSGIYVATSKTATLNGIIDGDGGLTKLSLGTLVISGPDTKTYLGETIVAQGTLQVKTAVSSHITVKAGAKLIAVPAMVPGGVTVEEGGTWDSALPPGWWGNGDPNNNGNWSDPDNWGDGIPVEGGVALLPTVTGYGNHPGNNTRVVTVDEDVIIADLRIPQTDGSFRNNVTLAADLSVGRVLDGPSAWGGMAQITIPSDYTFTFGLNDAVTSLVQLYGTGTARKVGSGKASMFPPGMSDTFNGHLIVAEGIYASWRAVCSVVTVEDGATLEALESMATCSTTLNGAGWLGQGAMHATDNGTVRGPLTFGTDPTINVDGTNATTYKTTTVTGNVTGEGDFTKIGLGKLIFESGTKNYTGETIVEAGTLEVRTTLTNSHVTVKAGATLVGAPVFFPMGVTVEEGGTWDRGPNFWWGNGDSNNNGNWSDGANWIWGVPPAADEVALLTDVTGNGDDASPTRTVTIDVPVTVADVKLPLSAGPYINRLLLAADMTIGKVSVVNGWIGCSRIDVPADKILTLGDASDWQLPSIYGDGTVKKVGTGQVSLGFGGGSPTTTLEYQVEDGTLYTNQYLDVRMLKALDNGTIKFNGAWW